MLSYAYQLKKLLKKPEKIRKLDLVKAEKQRGRPKVMNKVANVFFFLYSYFTVTVHSVM